MMHESMRDEFKVFLQNLHDEGLYKHERILESPQDAVIKVAGKEVRNFCANNYLGLSDNNEIMRAATEAMQMWGYGLSSVRFICGTQELHKRLEKRLAEFLHMDDTILFSSCFDANGAVFEPLLDERDAILSDALNHASIIDGVRL